MNWFLIYSFAVFLDLIGFLTGVLGVGLVLNRIIDLFAGPAFAFWFLVTGVKGWGWRLITGAIFEEIPFLGDFLPGWTITVWRISKKNSELESEESELNLSPATEGIAEYSNDYSPEQ